MKKTRCDVTLCEMSQDAKVTSHTSNIYVNKNGPRDKRNEEREREQTSPHQDEEERRRGGEGGRESHI